MSAEGDDRAAAQAARCFNAANSHFRAQRWHEALSGYEEALALHATLEPACLQRARCLVRLARWQQARDAFAQLLHHNPAHYSAWLESGHLLRKMGRSDQALSAYARAVQVDADRHEAPLAIGRALEDADRIDEAAPHLDHAMKAAAARSAATLRDSLRYLGRTRTERGDLQRAFAVLRQALALARQDVDEEVRIQAAAHLRVDIAEVLLRDGQSDPALAQLQLARASGREDVLARISELGYGFNHWELAIEVARESLALHPGSAWAHWNLAQLLAECWRMDEAETILRQAEAIEPMPRATALRASIAGRRGDPDASLALYRQLHERTGDPSYASSVAMSALYSDRLRPEEVAQLHRTLFAPLGEQARSVSSFVREPFNGRRVRLGIVSGDFHRQHPVNIFMQPVLRELNRRRFEVFIYSNGRANDAQTALARERCDHWLASTTWSDGQLAARIDEDRIDLLLDLSGHTVGNRIQMFARRAAPVQCTYLGYPGSTGLPNMDWIVGDAHVTPTGCDALYSERIARLPGTVFCFAPEADFPLPDFDSRFATRALTFGCFNNVPKLTQRTLRLWGRILARLPQARLLLKAPSFYDEGARALFRSRLVEWGASPGQLVFRGPSGLADMMAEYGDVDIGLDPVPYNGGTTTLQAMWMGVPVVVMEGGHFVSRMGASFMRAAGLADWVAADDDAYVELAVARAADRHALLALKRELRARQQASPAWDVVRHTRTLEAALLHMVGAK